MPSQVFAAIFPVQMPRMVWPSMASTLPRCVHIEQRPLEAASEVLLGILSVAPHLALVGDASESAYGFDWILGNGSMCSF